MTFAYECDVDLSEYEDAEFTEEQIAQAQKDIEEAGYEWSREGNKISICGERHFSDYSNTTEEDVAEDIRATLRCSLEIDSDPRVRDIDPDCVHGETLEELEMRCYYEDRLPRRW